MDPWSSQISEEEINEQKSDLNHSPSTNNNSEFEDHFVDIIPTLVASQSSSIVTNTGTADTEFNNIINSPGIEDSRTNIKSASGVGNFEKLPDSQDYLASLEKKLKAIQTGSNQKSKPEARLISSLQETRESYMINLLASSNSGGIENSTSTTEDFSSSTATSEELVVNPILKKLAPEKQAINSEELIELLRADQLGLLLEEQQQQKEQNSKEEDVSLSPDQKNQETPEVEH